MSIRLVGDILTWLTALAIIVYALVGEVIESIEKAEKLRKKHPKLFRAITNRVTRTALLMVSILLLVHVAEQIDSGAEPPMFRFVPLPPPPIVENSDPPEPVDSLRRRTVRLTDELTVFWAERPTPLQPIQNPATDEERKRNAEWDRYWRETKAAYLGKRFRERILEIVREYRGKGVATGYLEEAVQQPDRLIGAAFDGGASLNDCFGYMSDVCQLRELAFHVGANDKPIHLMAEPSK